MKCVNCGVPLSKSQKKYCSRDCQHEYEQKLFVENWLNGSIDGNKDSKWVEVRDRVRKFLFEKHNNKCSKCGWGEVNQYTGKIPLEVEHIDEKSI